MNKLKLSIITPAYNASAYISDLYESLKKNIGNRTDVEWVIVDDGSNDNTKELIKSFNEEWVKYFFKKNGGLGSARTFGLRSAKGEYVWHMDADDFIVDGAFDKIFKLLDTSKYDVIKVADNHFDNITKKVTPEKLYSLKKFKKSPHVWPQGLVVRSRIIPKDFSFFPKNGDLAYMYIFDKIDWNKFYISNERLVNYRVNIDGSMSTSKNIQVDLRASKYNYILSESLVTKKYKKVSIKRSANDYAYALFVNKTKKERLVTPEYISKLPFIYKIVIFLVKITPKLIAKMALK